VKEKNECFSGGKRRECDAEDSFELADEIAVYAWFRGWLDEGEVARILGES
jgi:hypothetical protein